MFPTKCKNKFRWYLKAKVRKTPKSGDTVIENFERGKQIAWGWFHQIKIFNSLICTEAEKLNQRFPPKPQASNTASKKLPGKLFIKKKKKTHISSPITWAYCGSAIEAAMCFVLKLSKWFRCTGQVLFPHPRPELRQDPSGSHLPWF